MFRPCWYILIVLLKEAICFGIKPYDAKIVSLSAWPENAEFDISKVRLIGRERLLNGTITLPRDVDNDHYSFSGEAFCDAAGDGNFKLLPFHISRMPICEAIKKHRSRFMSDGDYGWHTDLPIHNDTCPIPKGTYYLKNIQISSANWPANMPRGYIRGNGSYYRDNKVVGIYSVTILITDKEFR